MRLLFIKVFIEGEADKLILKNGQAKLRILYQLKLFILSVSYSKFARELTIFKTFQLIYFQLL